MRVAASEYIRRRYPHLKPIPKIGGEYMDLTLIWHEEWDDLYLAQDRQLRYVVVASEQVVARLLHNVNADRED